jgi:hypothetical protein
MRWIAGPPVRPSRPARARRLSRRQQTACRGTASRCRGTRWRKICPCSKSIAQHHQQPQEGNPCGRNEVERQRNPLETRLEPIADHQRIRRDRETQQQKARGEQDREDNACDGGRPRRAEPGSDDRGVGRHRSHAPCLCPESCSISIVCCAIMRSSSVRTTQAETGEASLLIRAAPT